jgi:hypothetical protein
VISKRHCPQTGVVNFFTAADPLIAVGSISEAATSAHYDWHCYLDDPIAGTAADMAIAEARLKKAIASRRERALLTL